MRGRRRAGGRLADVREVGGVDGRAAVDAVRGVGRQGVVPQRVLTGGRRRHVGGVAVGTHPVGRVPGLAGQVVARARDLGHRRGRREDGEQSDGKGSLHSRDPPPPVEVKLRFRDPATQAKKG